MFLSQTGTGHNENEEPIRDQRGSSLLSIQAQVTGAATFNVNGRVSPDAPWMPIKTAVTAGFLEAIATVPFIQLEVSSGSGTVKLWVHEG